MPFVAECCADLKIASIFKTLACFNINIDIKYYNKLYQSWALYNNVFSWISPDRPSLDLYRHHVSNSAPILFLCFFKYKHILHFHTDQMFF